VKPNGYRAIIAYVCMYICKLPGNASKTSESMENGHTFGKNSSTIVKNL